MTRPGGSEEADAAVVAAVAAVVAATAKFEVSSVAKNAGILSFVSVEESPSIETEIPQTGKNMNPDHTVRTDFGSKRFDSGSIGPSGSP